MTLIREFLTRPVDGRNLIGNYGAGGFAASYIASLGSREAMYITSLNVTIIGGGGATHNTDYGGIPGLTNGVTVRTVNTTPATVLDLMNGFPVQNNAGWHAIASSIYEQTGGVVEFVARMEFGEPVELQDGWQFLVDLNDDFTALVNHNYFIEGYRVTGRKHQFA